MMKPLAGIRIVEVSYRRSGSLAALLAAGLGADVVSYRQANPASAIEVAEAAYYDRGKRTLQSALDAVQVARRADVLVTDMRPAQLRELGLPTTEHELDSFRSGLVHVSISSFGLSGPHSDWHSSELTDWAGGGLAILSRRADDDVPPAPVLPPRRQADLLGGVAGLAALFVARRYAATEHRSVQADVSRIEVFASMGHHLFPAWLWSGAMLGRTGSPLGEYGMSLPAADGPVYVRAVEDRQWLALAKLLDIPDDIAAERKDGMLLHHRDPRAVRELVAPRVLSWTAADFIREAQAAGVPVAEQATIADVLASDQLAHREAWRDIIVGDQRVTVPAFPALEPEHRAPATRVRVEEVLASWS